jgi:coproporphyrinogen III oxidase
MRAASSRFYQFPLMVAAAILLTLPTTLSWLLPKSSLRIRGNIHRFPLLDKKHQADNEVTTMKTTMTDAEEANTSDIFFDFVSFLQETQAEIISSIEEMDGSGESFSNDTWGVFSEDAGQDTNILSGGITRVLQGGDVVEKGACSLTLIRRGVLTAERAAAIRSRQDLDIKAGDVYSAAALSIVLHSRSPMVPTFRSDVRVFFVQSDTDTMAWFGGGADLTPYYFFDEDASSFHNMYKDLCKNNPEGFSYQELKQMCDEYFYLPARSEHRGTGGIFFDDLGATTPGAVEFVKSVAKAWMPSWIPIVQKRRTIPFSEKQKQWQLLRRGRYLEFNLLYDRGVKFGLANANPRVEGVMVSGK